MQSQKPTAAFVLTLIGGVIIILTGLVVAAVGAIFTFFIGGIGGVFGLVGVLWGVLMIVSAVMLNNNPASHTTWGVLIIIFSVLSWFGSFGGFFIGFLLGLIGGVLAVAWHPSTTTTPPASPPLA